ncbi:MAG: glycosyltransferase [Myxococcales bacterium]|nr:glycosyltransferase [Myxococcales bacterium]
MVRNVTPLTDRKRTGTRVLFVTTGLATGGAEAMLVKLLPSLRQQRIQVRVASLLGHGTLGEKLEQFGIRVVDLGMRDLRTAPKGLATFARSVAEFRPTIVQGWMYHGNLVASGAIAWPGLGDRVVFGVRHSLHDLSHESRSTRWAIRANKIVSPMAARVVYNSETARRQHERLGFSHRRSIVVPNGFDVATFRPDPAARAEVRHELQLKVSQCLVGLVSRLHPTKGHVVLARAAREVLDARPDAQFLLVGRGVSGEGTELAKVIRDLALSGSIIRLDERQDIPRLTAALDIAVSASWGEGFSNAVGEAMCCGVPCVVTDVGDSRAIVGKAGRVVAPGDHHALARSILELIGLPAERRREIGEAARQRILDNYSLPRVVEQYRDLYTTISGC